MAVSHEVAATFRSDTPDRKLSRNVRAQTYRRCRRHRTPPSAIETSCPYSVSLRRFRPRNGCVPPYISIRRGRTLKVRIGIEEFSEPRTNAGTRDVEIMEVIRLALMTHRPHVNDLACPWN